jgi:ribosome-associated protein
MQAQVRQYYNLEELWQATPAQRRKAVEQAPAAE